MTPSDLTGLPDNILRKMVEEARAEAARQALLVQRYEPAYLGLPHVVRERNEARADCVRMSMRAGELGIEVARLEGLLLSVARVIRGRDGLPCWCDDYDARPDHTHSAKCIEARRIRAKREKGEARTTCRHGVQWPDFCQFNCAIGKPAQREKEK